MSGRRITHAAALNMSIDQLITYILCNNPSMLERQPDGTWYTKRRGLNMDGHAKPGKIDYVLVAVEAGKYPLGPPVPPGPAPPAPPAPPAGPPAPPGPVGPYAPAGPAGPAPRPRTPSPAPAGPYAPAGPAPRPRTPSLAGPPAGPAGPALRPRTPSLVSPSSPPSEEEETEEEVISPGTPAPTPFAAAPAVPAVVPAGPQGQPQGSPMKIEEGRPLYLQQEETSPVAPLMDPRLLEKTMQAKQVELASQMLELNKNPEDQTLKTLVARLLRELVSYQMRMFNIAKTIGKISAATAAENIKVLLNIGALAETDKGDLQTLVETDTAIAAYLNEKLHPVPVAAATAPTVYAQSLQRQKEKPPSPVAAAAAAAVTPSPQRQKEKTPIPTPVVAAPVVHPSLTASTVYAQSLQRQKVEPSVPVPTAVAPSLAASTVVVTPSPSLQISTVDAPSPPRGGKENPPTPVSVTAAARSPFLLLPKKEEKEEEEEVISPGTPPSTPLAAAPAVPAVPQGQPQGPLAAAQGSPMQVEGPLYPQQEIPPVVPMDLERLEEAMQAKQVELTGQMSELIKNPEDQNLKTSVVQLLRELINHQMTIFSNAVAAGKIDAATAAKNITELSRIGAMAEIGKGALRTLVEEDAAIAAHLNEILHPVPVALYPSLQRQKEKSPSPVAAAAAAAVTPSPQRQKEKTPIPIPIPAPAAPAAPSPTRQKEKTPAPAPAPSAPFTPAPRGGGGGKRRFMQNPRDVFPGRQKL
jgi:hypothetical protein